MTTSRWFSSSQRSQNGCSPQSHPRRCCGGEGKTSKDSRGEDFYSFSSCKLLKTPRRPLERLSGALEAILVARERGHVIPTGTEIASLLHLLSFEITMSSWSLMLAKTFLSDTFCS